MKSISIAFIGLLMGVAAYKTGHAPGAATTQHSMTRSGDTSACHRLGGLCERASGG